MKAVLFFDLPEEQAEHDFALNGHKYAAVISDVLEELRSKSKYGDGRPMLPDDVSKMIYDLLSERGLDLG